MNRIASLNDAFRKTFWGGTVMMTDSVQALPVMVRADALVQVATFDDFNADNDPHEEHDFGSFNLCGRRFFWKIDYYDKDLQALRFLRASRERTYAASDTAISLDVIGRRRDCSSCSQSVFVILARSMSDWGADPVRPHQVARPERPGDSAVWQLLSGTRPSTIVCCGPRVHLENVG